MIKIDVFIKDKNWNKYISNPNKYLNQQVNKINFKKFIKSRFVNLSIMLTGNNEIRILNKKFRKKNKSTDVLSFPNYNPEEIKEKFKSKKKIYLGDIVLNLYKIDEKKKYFKKNFNKLWIHGLVHLLGYRHYKNKDFSKMKKVEDQFIKQLKC